MAIQRRFIKPVQKPDQIFTDLFAMTLSKLMGANLVRQDDYDKINRVKQDLLKKSEDIDKLRVKLWKTECKLQGFVRYYKKWKPVTRLVERRTKQLHDQKVYIDFSAFPKDISENLKEAYNCYVHDLKMACYIMILRTIEISVSQIYSQYNKPQLDKHGNEIFVAAKVKLNFLKTKKLIGGADYLVAKGFIEARNDSVHELYTPTEKQIMSAFETVISIANTLKANLKKKK